MNKIDELLKIKELLDSGIISESEFKELKKNLLNDLKKTDAQENIIESNYIKEEDSATNRLDDVEKSSVDNFEIPLLKKGNDVTDKLIKKIGLILLVTFILCIIIESVNINSFTHNSKNDNLEVDTSKVKPIENNSTISTEIAPDPSARAADKYVPEGQNSENLEVDDNGEKIYKNWEDYKVGPKNINCNQGIHTESRWISVADFSTLNVTTFQHRFYDKSRIYDQNNNLIWEWKGESVQDATWYLREHDVDISGNDKVKIEFYQGYSSPFCNGYLEVNFGKY